MGGTFSNSITEEQKTAINHAINKVDDDDKLQLEKLLEQTSKQIEKPDGSSTDVSSTDEPQVTIEIFGSEKANNEGFYINDYKIKTHNLDKTFSPNDQVEHFLKNVFGYIENEHKPKEEQQPKTNFFHAYKKTITIEPTEKEEEEEEVKQSGGKKKRSRNRKPKSRHRKTKKH